MKPVIGIIIDWQEKGDFSEFPHFALRQHYVDAVRLAGGLPVLIPYVDVGEGYYYLEKIDGLLVPGGFYQTPDCWYVGDDEASPYEESPRFQFEASMIKRFLALNKPLFGICAGMQMLGGVLGCKLTPNIQKFLKKPLDHFNLKKPHDVEIDSNSKLSTIINEAIISTNTHHREAVVEVSNEVRIAAQSLDGCIEAIEVKNHKFALGVQWHPEMLCHSEEQIKDNNAHFAIFKEFVKLCEK